MVIFYYYVTNRSSGWNFAFDVLHNIIRAGGQDGFQQRDTQFFLTEIFKRLARFKVFRLYNYYVFVRR